MANEQLVKKLTITAFTDIRCQTKINDPFDIVLQVNPTEIAVGGNATPREFYNNCQFHSACSIPRGGALVNIDL